MSAISRFIQARLSPAGDFGLHLTIGAVLLLAASAMFGAIAEDVRHADAITLLDVRIAQWLHAHAHAGMTRLMLVVTHVHGVTGISILTAGFALYLWHQQARYWLLALLVAVAGGSLLNVAMKYTFQRARPTFDDPLLTLMTYSFPSGHTAGSTVFYGVLACYLFSRLRGHATRIAVALGALVMIALVGISRMYLGVHYFSDVLAAFAEGAAWLSLTITGVSTLRRRRLYRRNQTSGAAHA